MPLTTGTGVTLFAQLISPVILNRPTKLATTNPAAAVSSLEKLRAIATAAIAFIGCTGRGSPNVMPVRIFAAPVNSSVEGRDIEFVRTKAVMSGRRVPRSPREPDSSGKGASLRVNKLCLLIRRRCGKAFRGAKENMMRIVKRKGQTEESIKRCTDIYISQDMFAMLCRGASFAVGGLRELSRSCR